MRRRVLYDYILRRENVVWLHVFLLTITVQLNDNLN